MNTVQLEGRVATDVSLKYVGEKGTAKTWCILEVADKGDRKDRIPLTAWGDRAEEFANSVTKGTELKITNGKLSVSRFKPQGSEQWKDDWSVTVFEWEATGSGEQSQGMGSELTFNDDDDVPF